MVSYNQGKQLKQKKGKVNKMMKGLHDGEFVGMHFDEVLAELQARGIEPDEVDYPSADELGGITIGSVYLSYYIVEFDENDVCDSCYHGECEE